MKIKIAPSTLSANINHLEKDINEIETSADLLHIDIMDGKFVPPTVFSPQIVASIKTKLAKDVHLMVIEPEKSHIDDYAKAGADIITIHFEACKDIEKTIAKIKKLGIKAGISINPPTPVEKILPFIDKIDMVLVMSVNPGYGGQKLIPEVLEKIRILRKIKTDLAIEVDGGINKETIKKVVSAGANIIVAGSAIFDKQDRKKAIEELRKEAYSSNL
jgi:ribulose-phosphate 3-epimerase